MNNFTRWIVGIIAIVCFPFTLVLLTLYALFYKIPVFAGKIVEDIFKGIREKWSGQ